MNYKKIKFISLFDNPDKMCNIIWKVKITSVDYLGEMIEVFIEDEKKIKYKGLTINKGEIYPTPKKDDFLEIDKVQYRYDENFKLRFFIHAKIFNTNEEDKNKNNIVAGQSVENAISLINKYIEDAKKRKDGNPKDLQENPIELDKNEKKEPENNIFSKGNSKNYNILLESNQSKEPEKDPIDKEKAKTKKPEKNINYKEDIKIKESENKFSNNGNNENKTKKSPKISREIDISKTNEFDYDFTAINIIKSLKNYLDINQDLLTNLFIVDSVEENFSLKCFDNNKIFFLKKNNNYLGNLSLCKNDILLINDYYLEKKTKNIEPTKITIIEKLTDENLFYVLQNYSEIAKKYIWGKIVDIDENKKKLTLLDNNSTIYEIKNIKNEVKFGQFFLFSKYNIINHNTKKLV